MQTFMCRLREKAVSVKVLRRLSCSRSRLTGLLWRMRATRHQVRVMVKVVGVLAVSFWLSISQPVVGSLTVFNLGASLLRNMKGSRMICLLGYLVRVLQVNLIICRCQRKLLVVVTMCSTRVPQAKMLIDRSLRRLSRQTGQQRDTEVLVLEVLVLMVSTKWGNPEAIVLCLRVGRQALTTCCLRSMTRCSMVRAPSKVNLRMA